MKHFLKFEVDGNGLLQCEKLEGIDGKVPFDKLREGIGNIVQFVYHVDLGDEKIVIVVDEEGLLEQLKPTFWLYDKETLSVEPYPLVGKVLVVRLDDDGETYCLTDKEIEMVKSKVMVYGDTSMYLLPLNKGYIKRSNEILNELFKGN